MKTLYGSPMMCCFLALVPSFVNANGFSAPNLRCHSPVRPCFKVGSISREKEYVGSHVGEEIFFFFFFGTSSSLLHASQTDLESMSENYVISVE